MKFNCLSRDGTQLTVVSSAATKATKVKISIGYKDDHWSILLSQRQTLALIDDLQNSLSNLETINE